MAKQKDFKRESVRSTCMLWLQQAIERCNENGFKVVVASDEEGNNWNELEAKSMEYEGTKDGFIALGVFRSVDEEEVFEPIELCKAQVGEDWCGEPEYLSEYCKKHYKEFILNKHE